MWLLKQSCSALMHVHLIVEIHAVNEKSSEPVCPSTPQETVVGSDQCRSPFVQSNLNDQESRQIRFVDAVTSDKYA